MIEGPELITEILILLLGGLGGFMVHALTMKVNFKQRTIENKIKVFDALIANWVGMRNFIYSRFRYEAGQPIRNEAHQELDQLYGKIQQLIGEAFLVCDDDSLCLEINELTEVLYRTDWANEARETANEKMENIKVSAIKLVGRMREDVKSSSRFEWVDLVHIASGLKPFGGDGSARGKK